MSRLKRTLSCGPGEVVADGGCRPPAAGRECADREPAQHHSRNHFAITTNPRSRRALRHTTHGNRIYRSSAQMFTYGGARRIEESAGRRKANATWPGRRRGG